MKRCFKCGVQKPLDEFYRHPMMADGYLGKCKDCTKADVQANYAARRTQYQAYDRERLTRPERRLKKQLYERRSRVIHPERARARAAVSNAIRDGRLRRSPCRVCGERAEAHHEDYSRPFDVDWLCFRHHREEHGQVVAA